MNRNCRGRSRQNCQRLKLKQTVKRPVMAALIVNEVVRIPEEKKYKLKDCVVVIDKPPYWGTHYDTTMSARKVATSLSEAIEALKRYIL